MTGRPTRPILLLGLLAGTLFAGCTAPADGPDPEAAVFSLSCPEPCAVGIDSGTRWEPAVAVDPTDARHIVASSHDQTVDPSTGDRIAWPLAHVSFDGGATWKTARLPGGPSAPPDHPLHRYTMMFDSVPTFLADGTLLWTAIAMTGAQNTAARAAVAGDASLVLLRSVDGGVSFPESLTIADGEGVHLFHPYGDLASPLQFAAVMQDKQWMAVGPDGTLLLVWSRNAGGNPECSDPWIEAECGSLVWSVSRDDGRTWSEAARMVGGEVYSGAFPIIRSDGAWVVAYRDTRPSELWVAISIDDGTTWDRARIDVTTKFPVLALSRTEDGERLFLAYPKSDQGPDGGQSVVLRWSDDGGVTWSDARLLDAPEVEGRTIPAIAAGPDGTAYVAYWYPKEDGAEYRAVAFRDDALTARVVLGTNIGGTFRTGDYMGLAALPDGGAFAVWNAFDGERFTVSGARLVAL